MTLPSASSRKQRRRGAAIAIAVLVSVTAVFLAGRQIAAGARFADLLKLSGELDRNDAISPQALARHMPDTEAIVAGGICREDIVQAGKKLVMRDLDRRNPAADTAAWHQALAGAEAYIRHSLSCLPANGDLWLRLAMLRNASAAPSEEIARLMRQSQMLDPAETGIVTARMALWTKLPQHTRHQARNAYDQDRGIVCSSPQKQFRTVCEQENGG